MTGRSDTVDNDRQEPPSAASFRNVHNVRSYHSHRHIQPGTSRPCCYTPKNLCAGITRKLAAQSFDQMAHFLVNLHEFGDRVCNFLPHYLPITLAETMHRHAHGTDAQSQFSTNLSIFSGCRLPREKRAQTLKLRRFSGFVRFPAQTRERSLEH